LAKGGRDSGKAQKAVSVEATVEDVVAADTQKHRRGPSRLVLLVAGLGLLAALALWIVPVLQVQPARERLATEVDLTPADRLALENQIFGDENAARSTLAIILAAAGLLLTAGIIWRRFEKSRELKSHEQFTRAVEQLGSERNDGSPRTQARLGGIYALERLAGEAEHEYWPIMEVLTAYVRDNAAWNPHTARTNGAPGAPVRPGADIQAVLAVLGRRRPPPHSSGQEKRLLDLRETDLRGANLSGSRLDGVSLYGAHLEQADATRAVLSRSNLREAWLTGASLTEVNLEGASLSRAHLEGARLNRANLQGADLSGADLRGADLWEANLKGCNLKDADLRGADLSACVLEGAILWRADLEDAVLTGAKLYETHLERANLLGVTGLTWEQGEDAYTDENTLLPEYLQPGSSRTLSAAITPAARRATVQRSPAPRAETVASLPPGAPGGYSQAGSLSPAMLQVATLQFATEQAAASQAMPAGAPSFQPAAPRQVSPQPTVARPATLEPAADRSSNPQPAAGSPMTFEPAFEPVAAGSSRPQSAAGSPMTFEPAFEPVAGGSSMPQSAAGTPLTFDPATLQRPAAGPSTAQATAASASTAEPMAGRQPTPQPSAAGSPTSPRTAGTAAMLQPASTGPATAAKSPTPSPPAEPATIEAVSDEGAMPEPPPAVDNVVQLNAPARRTRAARQAKPPAEPARPKKSALPKHRKQGLVKPA
jgi:uncharacterized protein YjbI with pentapeptide repeats